MSDKDDLLDGLLEAPVRRGARRVSPPRGAAPGLGPLDLLTLPAAQRRVVTWLSWHGSASSAEIATGVGLDAALAEATLRELVGAGSVHEALGDDGVSYRAVFHRSRATRLASPSERAVGSPRRRNGGLPARGPPLRGA